MGPSFPYLCSPEHSADIIKNLSPRKLHGFRRLRDTKGTGRTVTLHTDLQTFLNTRPRRGERHILLNPEYNRIHRAVIEYLTGTIPRVPFILFPASAPSILNRLFTLRTRPS
jgi:hypothetical protein